MFKVHNHVISFKDKDQLWSCDCIVKERLWNRSEKVDHLAYKYWCVLQSSGIIKMTRNLAQVFVKLQALYTERCIWDYAHVRDTCVYLSHTNR